jgi:sugar phosphate isomerase/epimerase
MTEKQGLKLGVTLHSFTPEYITYKWSLEDMLQLVSVLGGGVEIVGPAHQRGYPYLTNEFERIFKSSVERWGLTPTSYGTYADPFMLKDRDLNADEMVDYMVPQLKSAAQLGFSIARLQYFSYTVIERLLPWAEKLNLKMGYELHVPLMIKSEKTQG